MHHENSQLSISTRDTENNTNPYSCSNTELRFAKTKVRPPEPADKAVEQRVVILAVERHESVQAKGRRAGALLTAEKMPKTHRHFPQADEVAKGRIRFRPIAGRRLDNGVRVGGYVASVLLTEVIGRQIVVQRHHQSFLAIVRISISPFHSM